MRRWHGAGTGRRNSSPPSRYHRAGVRDTHMSETPHEPGLYREVAPDTNQRYVLSLPDEFGGEQSVPLVLVLHYAWGGSLPDYYGQELLEDVVHPALRDLGAIMVAPDCLHRDWSNPESEAELNHLLDFIGDTYGVDRHKVIVTGYSLGGMGTWYMAARNQRRFAAALPMAAIVPREATEVRWSIPVYVIHSRADEIVSIVPTERAVRRLQEQGAPIEFVVLDGVSHFETGHYFRPLRDAVPWIRGAWR
jgi:predicted peptidase